MPITVSAEKPQSFSPSSISTYQTKKKEDILQKLFALPILSLLKYDIRVLI